MPVLKVGAGRGVLTPPVGSMLMGYAPARAGQSVHDDLAATALAFEYGDKRAILISADVCIIKSPQSERFRQRVGDATGVALDNIILAAIHTHSGPAMRETPGGAPIDEGYIDDRFEPGVVKAARDAVGNLRPARMGVGTTISDVGVNRREIDRSGKVILGQNPWGCQDPVMTVIGFTGPDQKPIANLIHYGAHCTAAGINPEITRDWAGPMVDRLEAESGAMTVFMNGAIGDCGPRLSNGKTTGNIGLAMELGGRAAIDALRAYRSIREYREAGLHLLSDTIGLPCEPLPPASVIEDRIREMGDPGSLTGMKVWEYRMLLDRLEESRSEGPRQTRLTLGQTVVSVGPVAFVPFPFEIFSEITLRLRKYSPFVHTLSLSNANGSYAYFPSADQIPRGGYEIWVSKSMNLYSLADHADDAAVSENLRLLETLFDSRQA